MKMSLLGTGSALPEKIHTNDMLSDLVDTSDEWIKSRTGIGERRISTGDTVVSLAASACEEALKKAGKNASDVDLIILATCSPEMMIPSSACQVQDVISAKNAVAFDINAACGGFLFALNTVYAYFKGGLYKNALIVGSEVLSKIVDWSDRGTCILFGDGAGAVYVEADEALEDNYTFIQKSDGSMGGALTCGTRKLENPYFTGEDMNNFISMDGKEIYRFAVETIPEIINEVLDKAGITNGEVDYYMLHQANYKIIQSISKRLELSLERFPTNVENVGNMSSASIPVLIDECFRKGMLKMGDKIVLSGFGAGLTFGASVLML